MWPGRALFPTYPGATVAIEFTGSALSAVRPAEGVGQPACRRYFEPQAAPSLSPAFPMSSKSLRKGPAPTPAVCPGQVRLRPGAGGLRHYELHRDEYLYLDYGRHLAWGYIEMPPLTALQSWLTLALGGSFSG
ncbi:MAG: hypothetical protein WKG07_05440 [Hymenobacter sp.]